jgi:hypothetical protein
MARVVLEFQDHKMRDNPEAIKWLDECETRLNVELQRISTELLAFGDARVSINVQGGEPLKVLEIDADGNQRWVDE